MTDDFAVGDADCDIKGQLLDCEVVDAEGMELVGSWLDADDSEGSEVDGIGVGVAVVTSVDEEIDAGKRTTVWVRYTYLNAMPQLPNKVTVPDFGMVKVATPAEERP